MPVTTADLAHLRRCVVLAREALAAGDEPFGSILVGPNGEVLLEERNHVGAGDHTRHPELAIARWVGEHLPLAERGACTVYTSGEHCPMCAAAHAWNRLGRIVYATSSEQLSGWLAEWGLADGPVRTLPIGAIAPGIQVDGPAPELTAEVRALHAQLHGVTP